MMEQPLVSIISVNFNQGKVTHELIQSLEKLTYKNIEVIIVDNGSTEDLTSQLNESYDIPDINIIISKDNLGFAGGNNLGIKQAKGEYLYFVNNDTELPPNSIQPLLERFASDTSIGIISPKIKYFTSPETIQYAGYSSINPFTARNFAIGHKEIDKGQHDIAKQTHYAHGAAMMIKREIIASVGMMPEVFFLYYEELDWCEQIKRKGYRIYYEPKALIYHKESISVGKDSPLKTYYLTRNRILFMRRNFSYVHLCVFFIYFAFLTVPVKIVLFYLQSNNQHLTAFYKGIRWNIQNLLKEEG